VESNKPFAYQPIRDDQQGSMAGIPFPQPGQVAPETPAVPQIGHSMGTAERMSSEVSVRSHMAEMTIKFEIIGRVDLVFGRLLADEELLYRESER
jgi:hypothetical protein